MKIESIINNCITDQENIIQALIMRIDDLENKFSFQENTIDILNETILKQYNDIDVLKNQISQIIARIKINAPNDDVQGINNQLELPPHY